MVGGGENPGALLLKREGSAEVHRRRRHEVDAGVPVLMLVPLEECALVRDIA